MCVCVCVLLSVDLATAVQYRVCQLHLNLGCNYNPCSTASCAHAAICDMPWGSDDSDGYVYSTVLVVELRQQQAVQRQFEMSQ